MTRISDFENVARAIFSPQMIGENGELLLAAFALRIFKDGTMDMMSHSMSLTVVKGVRLHMLALIL